MSAGVRTGNDANLCGSRSKRAGQRRRKLAGPCCGSSTNKNNSYRPPFIEEVVADDATRTDTKDNGTNSIATIQQPFIRCATYARYSSDLQRQTSVEDQVRNCRQT